MHGTSRPSGRSYPTAWTPSSSDPRPDDQPAASRPELLFLGRLDPRNGLDTVLAAMPQVLEHLPGRAPDRRRRRAAPPRLRADGTAAGRGGRVPGPGQRRSSRTLRAGRPVPLPHDARPPSASRCSRRWPAAPPWWSPTSSASASSSAEAPRRCWHRRTGRRPGRDAVLALLGDSRPALASWARAGRQKAEEYAWPRDRRAGDGRLPAGAAVILGGRWPARPRAARPCWRMARWRPTAPSSGRW